jgi:hypothetical protein
MKTLIVSLLFIVACGSGSSNTEPADTSTTYHYGCVDLKSEFPELYRYLLNKQSECCDSLEICVGGEAEEFCRSFEGKTYLEAMDYGDKLDSMSCDEFMKSSLGCCSFPAEPNNSEEIIIPAV